MGCTKSLPSQEGRLPSIPFLNKFQEIINLSNPLNINQKYRYLMEIVRDQTAGEGVFKTSAYKCLTTKDELKKKIKEFWDTRTMGDAKNWLLLKQAVESKDESLAKSLFRKASLVMVSQSIQMTIDSKLMRYEIPIFCINEPVQYSKVDLAHANLEKSFAPANVQVVLRNPHKEDCKLSVSNTVSIKQLKKKYLKSVSGSKVRLFCRGRQLVDDCTVGHYKIESGDVIQSLIH